MQRLSERGERRVWHPRNAQLMGYAGKEIIFDGAGGADRGLGASIGGAGKGLCGHFGTFRMTFKSGMALGRKGGAGWTPCLS